MSGNCDVIVMFRIYGQFGALGGGGGGGGGDCLVVTQIRVKTKKTNFFSRIPLFIPLQL